jgi:DNA-directed RNA polymerase subunit RPC12/RpoP
MTEAYRCPHCNGAFAVDPAKPTTLFACPHCGKKIQIQRRAPTTSQPAESQPAEDHPTSVPPQSTSGPAVDAPDRPATPEKTEADVAQRKAIDAILPPRFTIAEDSRPLGDPSAVWIPDEQLGFKPIDAFTVTVAHRGQTYTVRAAPSRARSRWRTILSAVLVIVSLILLIVAFYLLRGR